MSEFKILLDYYQVWLSMWPLYLILNKLLRAEDENEHGSVEEHLTLVESYQLGQASSNENCKGSILPQSHYVECYFVGPTCKPATYLGLRSCLCCDGLESSWCPQLYCSDVGGALLHN